MTMALTPPKELSISRVVGFGAFAVTAALFLLVSATAGMRSLGLTVLAGAVMQMASGRIAYGWEGQAPSGQITGVPAVVLSLLTGAAGAVMVFQPEFMLQMLGWSER